MWTPLRGAAVCLLFGALGCRSVNPIDYAAYHTDCIRPRPFRSGPVLLTFTKGPDHTVVAAGTNPDWFDARFDVDVPFKFFPRFRQRRYRRQPSHRIDVIDEREADQESIPQGNRVPINPSAGSLLMDCLFLRMSDREFGLGAPRVIIEQDLDISPDRKLLRLRLYANFVEADNCGRWRWDYTQFEDAWSIDVAKAGEGFLFERIVEPSNTHVTFDRRVEAIRYRGTEYNLSDLNAPLMALRIHADRFGSDEPWLTPLFRSITARLKEADQFSR